MDPQQLHTFVTVARLGSFSQAATALGYTQSAISQQIATLESDLKVALLHRRPVTVTPAGARLLEHAGPILLRMQAARADLARLSGAAPALVRLDATPLAAHLVPAAVHRLVADVPQVEPTVRIVGRATVAADVATGVVDVGLVDGVAAPNDPLNLHLDAPLHALAVAEADLVVVLPADHPLAARTGLGLADLADARWIDAPDLGMPLAALHAAVGTGTFPASLRYQGGALGPLAALAAAGHGLLALPAPAAAGLTGLVAVPLSTPRLVHRIELLHPPGATAAIAAITAALGAAN